MQNDTQKTQHTRRLKCTIMFRLCACALQVVAKRYTGLHDWWLFKTFATEVLTHVDFGTDDPESRLLRAEAAHLDLAAGTAVLMLPKADGDLKNT